MSTQDEEWQQIALQKSDQVNDVLASRHILDDEVKMVIAHAEASGKKLYQPDGAHFLARLRIANATYYVEYSVAGEKTYAVHTAYYHRAEIGGEA